MAPMKVLRKIRRAILRDEPGYYDMYENRSERFFARLYLHQIQKTLQAEGFYGSLKILDAGCQAGRLAIPLALEGHQVTGVDSSGVGLRRLIRHARSSGASLRVLRADLTHWLPRQSEGSFDVVLCTEVLYLRPNYRFLLGELSRLLRPGGILFVSHRPPGYYLWEALQRKDPEAVHRLLTAKEGLLGGSYYNWQDPEDLNALYRELHLEVLSICPIGLISWLAKNPERLDGLAQELLFQAELAVQEKIQGIGRYLLVCARKKPA